MHFAKRNLYKWQTQSVWFKIHRAGIWGSRNAEIICLCSVYVGFIIAYVLKQWVCFQYGPELIPLVAPIYFFHPCACSTPLILEFLELTPLAQRGISNVHDLRVIRIYLPSAEYFPLVRLDHKVDPQLDWSLTVDNLLYPSQNRTLQICCLQAGKLVLTRHHGPIETVLLLLFGRPEIFFIWNQCINTTKE